ncbi:STM4015 family protein [Deinococcus lacus]|uniref:STM4015 family protein n=1 Tax=Deinococcus lacus TaxID=392561 RepID=A0ABW1YFM4_9DEIO
MPNRFAAWLSACGGDDVEVDSSEVRDALIAAREQLPKVHALFIGDITYEECEVSWIQNTDLSPLLSAYGNLTHFGVRGGSGLSLGQLDLSELVELQVQAGGLSAEVVREVMKARLPKLEHLELYLGTDNYGATSSVDDLTPLLDGTLFPRLKYLGLKNSDYQDAIAQVIADAPALDGLETLDLSMGTLSDEGGQALLGSERVKTLSKLDLHHHFMSDEMMQKLEGLGIEVDVSEQEESDEDDGEVWRYVALGE